MSQTSLRRVAFLAVAALIWLTSACFSRVDIDIAQRAADEFHLRANDGQADAIYDDATNRYRMSISRELNRSRFARFRRKMGACPSSTATSIVVNVGSQGTTATASYKTTCSAGVLDESFLWGLRTARRSLAHTMRRARRFSATR
jgi:hypothetical protein